MLIQEILFFASSFTPPPFKQQWDFSAESLKKALLFLGLQAVVLGEQDFAGENTFLKSLSVETKLLISNSSDSFPYPHVKWIKKSFGAHTFYLVSAVLPELFNPEQQHFFTDPLLALKNVFHDLQKSGYEKDNPWHHAILLSHMGMEKDRELTKLFPHIDWIIGAHSQDFLSTPEVWEKTKIVQVKNRNHYLGVVTFTLDEPQGIYTLHETSEHKKNLLVPNPMTPFIEDYRTALLALQKNQAIPVIVPALSSPYRKQESQPSYPSTKDCLSCHSQIYEHTTKTPHALAYVTLFQKKAHYNSQCIGCHTLGFQDPKGFSTPQDVVRLGNPSQQTEYWEEFQKIFQSHVSIRSQNSTELQKMSKAWENLDKKFAVTHQYANVQCLNCHKITPDHHLTGNTPSLRETKKDITARCLSCHTKEQSPDWYLQGNLNSVIFDKKYEQMDHP